MLRVGEGPCGERGVGFVFPGAHGDPGGLRARREGGGFIPRGDCLGVFVLRGEHEREGCRARWRPVRRPFSARAIFQASRSRSSD